MPAAIAAASQEVTVRPVATMPIFVTPNDAGITFQRLSQVPSPHTPTPEPEPEVSAIQREREGMLTIYKSPNSLPVPLFGKLAGKSKDQINCDLKAGKLLSISLGNRGQHVLDWQLVPLKQKLAQVLMNQYPHTDSWGQYRILTWLNSALSDRAAIDVLTSNNLGTVLGVIALHQQPMHSPKDELSRLSESARQHIQQLVGNDAVLEVA